MKGVLLEVEHRMGASLRCGMEDATNCAMKVHNWCEHPALKAMQRHHGQCTREYIYARGTICFTF
jgi:hypothetical protein